MDRSLYIKVSCPRCNHSLMDHLVYLHYKPSIKLQIETRGERIAVHLGSRYGSHERICDVSIPHGEINEFFCPYCLENLRGTDFCRLCGAPMVTMGLEKGGHVVVCSRNGCPGEYLAFEEISDALLNFSLNHAQETGEYH